MVQSGDEYRAGNRKRLQKYYSKHLQEGKKRITALLSAEAYQCIQEQQEQREDVSISALVDEAVRVAFGGNIREILPQSEPDTADRDAELIRIYESIPGRGNAQARADALNAAGVPVKGVWNKKNAGDLYRAAIRKREATNV
jgi:hypothetical protein